MARYRSATVLSLRAPADALFDAVLAPTSWLRGWPFVERLDQVAVGREDGVGDRYRVTVRAPLPYRLSWEMETVAAHRPRCITWSAAGHLRGTAHWELFSRGDHTDITCTWSVDTNRFWLSALTPVARPVFDRNHDTLMRAGATALSRHLEADVLVFLTGHAHRRRRRSGSWWRARTGP